MTLSATTTGGSNNLHGTLRFLSKKYCAKRNKPRNNSNTIKRRRTARASLPTIRKSSTPRSDRLQVVVSIVNDNENNDAADCSVVTGEEKINIVSAANIEGKGPLSPEIVEVKVETSAAAALANDSATVGASTNNTIKDPDSQVKKDDEKKTSTTTTTRTTTTTKLLHPEDLAVYEEAEDVQKQALKKIETARWKVYNDQVQKVWGVYLYGLKHVMALNDLSDAPDAILPGNF
jgi:hypothetical protein